MAAFLDTNVLVYAFDRSAGAKRQRALTLLNDSATRLVISAQVLNEFYVTATGKLAQPLDLETAFEVVQTLSRLNVVAIDAELTQAAIRLSRDAQLSLWDALIVAAAQRAGCRTLLTEDLNHGQRIGDVEIVNPFI